MLGISSHQQNVTQNYNEVSLHIPAFARRKKRLLISIGEAMEKSDPSYITGEIVKWCVYFGEETW